MHFLKLDDKNCRIPNSQFDHFSCSGENINIPINTYNNNDTTNISIAKAGLFANEPTNGNAILSDQSIENGRNDENDIMKLSEGWSPVLYR